jgi:hypothetical protein
MSSLGLPTRVPCGPLPKLTHGSNRFSLPLAKLWTSHSLSLHPVLLTVSARAVYSKGTQASYSEADNSSVKLEPIKFLGLSSDAHPIDTLVVGVHCSMRPCYEARTLETSRRDRLKERSVHRETVWRSNCMRSPFRLRELWKKRSISKSCIVGCI